MKITLFIKKYLKSVKPDEIKYAGLKLKVTKFINKTNAR